MKTLNLRRMAWIASFVLVLVLVLALCMLPAGAEEECGEAARYDENGFCITCGAYEEAPLGTDGYYEVSNAGHLYWVAARIREKQPTELLKVKLMCNITVNKDLLNASGEPRNGAKRIWEPLGAEGAVVENVTFDGQGYYISGLYAVCDDAHDVGLFGRASSVTVTKLGIVDSYFGANTGFTGGIIAKATDACNISYCYVIATVESEYSGAGGIAGALEKESTACTVSFCYTTHAVAVYGADAATAIANCYYRANSETDTLDGTDYYTAELLLADGETSLYDALNDAVDTWVKSCRNALPALRAEHVFAHPCTLDCVAEGCDYLRSRDDAAPHAYDNNCDAYCEVCNTIRELAAEYKNHYRINGCDTVCRECGAAIAALTGHQYSNDCDAVCNNCDFERDAVPHLFRNVCDTKCTNCGYILENPVPHTYENGCARVCSVCGITRVPQHTYDSVCDSECNVCKAVRDGAHQYGEYTVTKAPTALKNGEQERTCALCGHKDVVAIARLGLSGGAIALIVVGCVVGASALTFGGFVLIWVVIKKRSLAEFFRKDSSQKGKKGGKKSSEKKKS